MMKKFWFILPLFLLAFGFSFAQQEATMEFESYYNNGFENEIQEATDLILQGKLESPSLTWEDTVGMLAICDAARAQWGFKYPGE